MLQYRALRRKIGGTAKDFWKESVDVNGKYTDKGYVSRSGSVSSDTSKVLPFALATLVALFGTLAFVVQATASP